MNKPFRRSLGFLLGATAFAALAAYLIDDWLGWLILCAALGWELAGHLRNIAKLDRWTRQPGTDENLTGDGAWAGIFSRIYRHEKEMHAIIARRKQELDHVIAAAQALSDGILILDTHNRIVFCNRIAERQFGLSAHKDRGQAVGDLIRHPDFIRHMQQADFTQALRLRVDRGNEQIFSIQVLLYAGQRKLLQVRDITKNEQLDKMHRDFIANVSHELRTPLTVLSGFVETLQEIDLARDEQHRYLGLMGEQAQRMQNIVHDLLALSSIESAPPPEELVISVVPFMERLAQEARLLSAGAHTITCESENSELLGAESELFSACLNLVSNAVRYTPPGGTIALGWQVNPIGARFFVCFNGRGIEAIHLLRLAERFYRVDRGRSREAGGTGLGLAIVKHIANRHQASLVITSTPQLGSCFAIDFPSSRLLTP